MEQPGVVEALSWAVAADLAGRAGPNYRLIEMHPAGGTYDVLRLSGPERGPHVELNRVGSIHYGATAGSLDAGAEIWGRLASGVQSVAALAETIAAELELPGVGCRGVEIYRIIASVLRQSALFRLGWRCLWGYEDSSGMSGCRVRDELFAPYRGDLIVEFDGDRVTGPQSEVENCWFLVDRDGLPLDGTGGAELWEIRLQQ